VGGWSGPAWEAATPGAGEPAPPVQETTAIAPTTAAATQASQVTRAGRGRPASGVW